MGYRISTAMAEFDHWSGSYDRTILQPLLFRPSHDLLMDHLTADDRRVLDIGCATSRFGETVLVRMPESQVCGLDLSTKMLDWGMPRCRHWRGKLHTVRGDSERLPFRDNTFDVVTCSHSFHHYPNQPRVVAEMFRVLRPGGRLMVIDGDRDGIWGWVIFDLLVTSIEGKVHHCSARQFRQLFQNAGFSNVKQEYRRGLIPFVLTIGYAEKAAVTHRTPLRKAA